MEHFFTSLSKRQTMLLLTGVTFGGQDCLGSYDFLAEGESDLLKHRAQELLTIPREKRIPLLVQEIKRLVNGRPAELYAADPLKLAGVLKGERAATREMLLSAFPEALGSAVRASLPPSGGRSQRKIRPEILPILRWKLEEVLTRAGARRAHFKFSDVLLLQTRELLTLCDHVGARMLAPAVAGLVTADREEWMGKLPPDHRLLLEQAMKVAGDRKLQDLDAKDLLALHSGEKGPPEAVRSAGAQRLARACLAQSPEFAARLVERQRGEFGAILVKWVREERAKAVNRGDGGRTELVDEMEGLEQRGLINKPARLPAPGKKGQVSGPSVAVPPKRPAAAPPGATGSLSAPRPPSRQLPLAAQARPSPSSQMRASAEAPRPAGDWIAEREKRKAGMSSAWNLQRSRQPDDSEPAITIPPAAVKGELMKPRPKPPPKPLGQYDVTGPLPQQKDPTRAIQLSKGDRPKTSPALQKMPMRRMGGTSVARMPRIASPDDVTDPGQIDRHGERETTDKGKDEE